ncbi:MAG: glycosyltransferase family 2 protein [Candidatus Falkowbacteria bacterium]
MKIVIGFITYNEGTAKYLPFFLPSLKQSLDFAFGNYETDASYKILAFDNSEQQDNSNSRYIKNNFTDIDLFWSSKNLGFAGAYNPMIGRAVDLGAEYFLMINPDTIIAEDSILNLIKILDANERLGAVAPRILKWDFVNSEKTDIVDSDGIAMTTSHRAYDSNQGKRRTDLSDAMVPIFGFTGAAVLLRLTVLVDVAFDICGRKEYLDELMFMYKEDVDLSYRLQLAGHPIMLCPSAIVYHDRSASPLGNGLWQIIKNRKNKSRLVREWSFLNQWIFVIRYSSLPWKLPVKLKIWVYQLAATLFAAIFEPYLLGQFKTIISNYKEIKLKYCQLKLKIALSDIEKILVK